ncbi:MAG: lytic transglycosylase domain-containing protein [Oricola sp.]
MRFIRSSRSLACAAAILGLAGCSTSGVVESVATAPETGEPAFAMAASDQAAEMSYAGPTVDSAAQPLAQIAHAQPSQPRSTMDAMIARYSAEYGVPETLVHRVVRRESTYNPRAKKGGHYGLMQIKPETARTMGYSGSDSGLYDAETNLKYGVKYLRGAWLLANGSEDRAVQLYSAGYYYEAKRRGMLAETGLRKG